MKQYSISIDCPNTDCDGEIGIIPEKTTIDLPEYPVMGEIRFRFEVPSEEMFCSKCGAGVSISTKVLSFGYTDPNFRRSERTVEERTSEN